MSLKDIKIGFKDKSLNLSNQRKSCVTGIPNKDFFDCSFWVSADRRFWKLASKKKNLILTKKVENFQKTITYFCPLFSLRGIRVTREEIENYR